MIHPINIEADLLNASNPQRPTLIEAKKRPRITYHRDGRRLRDGQLTSPTLPATGWTNMFIRAFTHRLATNMIDKPDDAAADTASIASTDSFIDVVDLKPRRSSNRETDKSTNNQVGRERRDSNQSATSSSGDNLDESPIASLDATNGNQMKTRFDTRRRPSTAPGVAAAAAASVALTPSCCASIGRSLKEFLRVDFANASCISAGSKTPLLLTPRSASTRVWTRQRGDAGGERRSLVDALLFDVASIASCGDRFTIQLDVHNTSSRPVNVQSSTSTKSKTKPRRQPITTRSANFYSPTSIRSSVKTALVKSKLHLMLMQKLRLVSPSPIRVLC